MANIFAGPLKNKDLTKSEKSIAEYFIANQYRICSKTLREVASTIGVSDASVLRFVRTLGYEGYNDLKEDIFRQIDQRMGEKPKVSLSSRLSVNANKVKDDELTASYLDLVFNNIQKTICDNSIGDFYRLVQMVVDSNRKYIVGLQGCKSAAAQLSLLLKFAVDDVVEITNADYSTHCQMRGIGDNDLLILFSISRYYKMDMAISELAHKNKAKICVITDSYIAPMANHADIVIVAETGSSSYFNSIVAMHSICEFLALLLARKKEDAIRERLDSSDEFSEFMRL